MLGESIAAGRAIGRRRAGRTTERCLMVQVCRHGPRLLLVVATAFAVAGCGDKLPPVYKVTGRVVFKNGKGNMHGLSQNGTLEFQSLTDPGEKPGSEIGPDGALKFF